MAELAMRRTATTGATAELEARTMRKVTLRLVPFLMLCYFIAYLDRVNIGFAGASMRADLDLSATAFGGAAGIFFVAYFFFEVPSNLALNAFGARRWIARIMLSWGIISGAQAFVTGEWSFNFVRALLGVAEAGFFPGIIFYLTLWFPTAYRGRIVGWFMFAIPISTVIGAPLSGLILGMEGIGGLHGWQWMFLIEAVPAVLMSGVVLYYLTDRPREARWLATDEREWLQQRLDRERAQRENILDLSWLKAMLDYRVIALGLVYMGCNIPQYGLSFFLPQIVKAFGISDISAGFITAVPYLVGAIGMVLWGAHSDKTGERTWHAAIAFGFMIVGLGGAAFVADPTLKMLLLMRRRLRLLRGAAGVLDAADGVPLRRRRSRRHRRREFDRQSRRLFRPAGVRAVARPDRQRCRRPDVSGRHRGDRHADRDRAGLQPRDQPQPGGPRRGVTTPHPSPVMPALVAGIHVLKALRGPRRGWPGRARP